MKEEKLQEQIHKWRMEEIESRKQAELMVERLKHQNNIEMQRIRNADIQRNKLRGLR
jgi:hypothetical protein